MNILAAERKLPGWTNFFLFTIVVSMALTLITTLTDIQSILTDSIGPLKYLGIAYDLAYLGILIGLGAYTIYSFLKFKDNAVNLGKMFLLLILIGNLSTLLIYNVLGVNISLGNFRDNFNISPEVTIADILRGVGYSAIWLLYLTFSKNLKETFPENTRKTYLPEKITFATGLLLPFVFYFVLMILTVNFPQIANAESSMPREFGLNEYSDGRFYFTKPNDLNIEKQQVSLFTSFNLTKEDRITFVMLSDVTGEEHQKYSESFFTESKKGVDEYITADLSTTTVKEEKKLTTSGFEYFEKRVELSSDPAYLFGTINVFDSDSQKVAGILYFSDKNSESEMESYLSQLINSIKFS